MFTICFDTICTGYTPVTQDAGIDNSNGTPIRFLTEAEAQAEMDSDEEFYDECFVCPLEEIGRKTIYTGE